jgi:DNA-binding MarR family transcriptional regulator
MPVPERITVNRKQEREWPGSSASATECALNIVNLSSRIEAYGMEIVRRHGISSIGAFNVLTILHGERESLAPSTIAERMIVTRGTVTGILDSLERRGLIERARHSDDGRMRLVSITAKGKRAVQKILPELHRAEREWFGVLKPAQRKTLVTLLAIVQRNGPA